jgi:hypothetical protein
MAKRSGFPRRDRDHYPTPPEAVGPLLPFLGPATRYIEPCAGAGSLISALASHGHICVAQYDLPLDARNSQYNPLDAFCFITNPPWDRKILHPTIDNLRKQLPTWLLLDADWMHTIQAAPYLHYCYMIISVGRVKWIPGTPHTGKDNAAWYLFVNKKTETYFVGR